MNHSNYRGKFQDKSIQIGRAVIPWDADKKCWFLPGGRSTRDEDVAYDAAFKIHELTRGAQ